MIFAGIPTAALCLELFTSHCGHSIADVWQNCQMGRMDGFGKVKFLTICYSFVARSTLRNYSERNGCLKKNDRRPDTVV